MDVYKIESTGLPSLSPIPTDLGSYYSGIYSIQGPTPMFSSASILSIKTQQLRLAFDLRD